MDKIEEQKQNQLKADLAKLEALLNTPMYTTNNGKILKNGQALNAPQIISELQGYRESLIHLSKMLEDVDENYPYTLEQFRNFVKNTLSR